MNDQQLQQAESLFEDFLQPQKIDVMNANPFILQRLAKIKRLEKIREVCNNALTQHNYTRQELFQVCIRERIVEIGKYREFMEDLKELEADNLIHSHRIKYDEKSDMPPVWFSAEYLRKIMHAIRNSNKSWENKARLCVAMLFGLRQGYRVGETANQKWFRIKYDENKLIVWDSKSKNRSKTKHGEGKTRYVSLFPDMKKVLLKYKEMCGVTDDNTYLFPSPTKPCEHIEEKTISDNWFAPILKQVGLREDKFLVRPPKLDKSGRPKKTHLFRYHVLRHTSAYFVLCCTNNGGKIDYDTAAEFLGHESTDTTRKHYARVMYHLVGAKIEQGEKAGLVKFNRNVALQQNVETMNKLFDRRVDYEAQQIRKEEIAIDKQIELEKVKLERVKIEKGVA